MVKESDKKTKKSSLTPAVGAILLVALLGVAYFIATTFVLPLPQVRAVVGVPPSTLARVAFTLIVWFLLAGIAYFLVALLVGKDKTNTQALPLPPRKKDMKKNKR